MHLRVHIILLLRVPWVDREAMAKKLDRLYKDNMVLQQKVDEFTKKDNKKDEGPPPEGVANYQVQNQCQYYYYTV